MANQIFISQAINKISSQVHLINNNKKEKKKQTCIEFSITPNKCNGGYITQKRIHLSIPALLYNNSKHSIHDSFLAHWIQPLTIYIYIYIHADKFAFTKILVNFEYSCHMTCLISFSTNGPRCLQDNRIPGTSYCVHPALNNIYIIWQQKPQVRNCQCLKWKWEAMPLTYKFNRDNRTLLRNCNIFIRRWNDCIWSYVPSLIKPPQTCFIKNLKFRKPYIFSHDLNSHHLQTSKISQRNNSFNQLLSLT